MTSDCGLSHAALIDRADRAISEAHTTRAVVRAGLTAASMRRPCRPWAGDMKPLKAPPPDPLWPPELLEPWWSVARSLIGMGEIMKQADRELDALWYRTLPTIETPMSLFEG